MKNNKIKDIASGATKIVMDNGVDIVKDGISSTINGIIWKIGLTVTLVVGILAGGCIGTNVIVDKLTTEKSEK